MDLPSTSFLLTQLWIRLGGCIDFSLPAFILESLYELIHSWCFVIFVSVGIYWTEGETGGVAEQQQTHTGFFSAADLRFPLVSKPTPHILCYPAFTFHKN